MTNDFSKMSKRELAEILHRDGDYSAYRGSVGGREGSIQDTVRTSTKAELVARVTARQK